MKIHATTEADSATRLTLSLDVDCAAVAPQPQPQPQPDPEPEPQPDPEPLPGVFFSNADLAVPIMPAASAWYKRIDAESAHPQSAAIVAAVKWGGDPPKFAETWLHNDFGHGAGIPYAVGSGNAPAAITFDGGWPGESDPGPYHVHPQAPIEAAGDRHLLFLDEQRKRLYEFFATARTATGYAIKIAANWDLTGPDNQRTPGWTSADAAGLPILPGLIRADEFERALQQTDPAKQHLGHALRITIPGANTAHAWLAPASHHGSSAAYSLPGRVPMGMRFRIKPAFDLSQFNKPSQVILRTLQLYGAILADNGSPFFLTGTSDARWDKHWDSLTQTKPGTSGTNNGMKGFRGQILLDNLEVVNFADSDVVTSVP